MTHIYVEQSREFKRGFVNGIAVARHYNEEEVNKVIDKILEELENE